MIQYLRLLDLGLSSGFKQEAVARRRQQISHRSQRVGNRRQRGSNMRQRDSHRRRVKRGMEVEMGGSHYSVPGIQELMVRRNIIVISPISRFILS